MVLGTRPNQTIVKCMVSGTRPNLSLHNQTILECIFLGRDVCGAEGCGRRNFVGTKGLPWPPNGRTNVQKRSALYVLCSSLFSLLLSLFSLLSLRFSLISSLFSLLRRSEADKRTNFRWSSKRQLKRARAPAQAPARVPACAPAHSPVGALAGAPGDALENENFPLVLPLLLSLVLPLVLVQIPAGPPRADFRWCSCRFPLVLHVKICGGPLGDSSSRWSFCLSSRWSSR